VQLHRLDYTILVVEDLDRALAFYAGILGIPIHHRSDPYAQLVTGTTRLALYTRAALARSLGRELTPPDPESPTTELGFVVADVDAAFATFTARGADGPVPPTDRPWPQRTAWLRDPDGHWIELIQNLPPS